MLFRSAILERIGDGTVTLAFRRWTRPTVKTGGTLRTAAGVLAIDAVDIVEQKDVTAEEAHQAGFTGLPELLEEIATSRPGTLYRIVFRRIGDDPRLTLREQAVMEDDEISRLRERLASLDRAAPWTARALKLIAEGPGRPASELATELGFEKLAAKRRIRSLKDLGLTESLDVGYRLSPRGKAFLNALRPTISTNE